MKLLGKGVSKKQKFVQVMRFWEYITTLSMIVVEIKGLLPDRPASVMNTKNLLKGRMKSGFDLITL